MRASWLMLALLIATPAQAGKKGKKNKEAPAPEPPPVEKPMPAAEPITLPCGWEPGAEFHYSYVRERTDAQNPALSGVRSTTPVVVKVTQGGNPMRMTYDSGESTYSGPPEAAQAVQAMVGDIDMPAMELVMVDGSVTEVANLAEMVKAMEPILKKALPPGAPPEVLEQTLAMFRDPATGTQLMLKEPGKLFAMHCIFVDIDSEVSVDVDFPNPLGGAPLPGHSVVRYKSHDAETITLETEDALDPDALQARLPEIVQQFAPPGVEVHEEMLKQVLATMPPIDNRMTGTLVYSLVDGFPISVDVTQHMGSKDHPMYRTDRWIWTRTDGSAGQE